MSSASGVSAGSFVPQCFSDFIASLPLVGKAEAAFRRVTVNKLDENGAPRFFDNIYDYNTNKTISTYTPTFIEEVATGDLYLDEPRALVRMKCAEITLGLPFYLVARTIWNLGKAAVLTATVAVHTLKQAGEAVWAGEEEKAARTLKQGVTVIFNALTQGIWRAVKGPFYAIAAECAALYGLVDPYRGRKFEAQVEMAWSEGVSFKQVLEQPPLYRGAPSLEACIQLLQNTHLFYLANCFQSRGNVNSSEVRVLAREAL